MIRLKRIYETPAKQDGFRILVDRLWPRGLSKEKARVDLWLREIAPSDGLRKWFSHQPEKWTAFQSRYKAELRSKKALLKEIQKTEREKGTVTLLYAARDEERNNAVALRQLLRKRRSD